jgi:cytochrome P450/NADPH-cytochrome P450 reductase
MTHTEIPQPPSRLIVGNLPELRRKGSIIESMMDLTAEYGGIVQLQAPGGRLVIVSDPDLAAELCDDERFEKILGPGLLRVRENIGDGLFTAYSQEKNWLLAHRILMPTFSHASMKAYVPDMVEMAEQLMGCLQARCEANAPVDVASEMTKLTLDTIALCGFSYRFDSFQRQDQHPFVDAMVTVLTENQSQMRRPKALNALMVGAHWRAQAAQKLMNDTVSEIIRERRAAGRLEGRMDLLEHMLHGVDKVTGESLSDENIRSQCLTFLVAGHETTSGLLSFAVYFLLHHPEVAARAQAEVDRVLGTDLSQPPTYEQIHALEYITQILEETLRLWPTAPAFTRGPKRPPGEVIGGKYFIPHGQPVQLLLPQIHRSTKVWGPDAEQFNPDRFSEQAKAERPAGVFLPFGTGERACIGRQFAMQEAKLVLGMLLQRFDLVNFENYQLRVKQSLTIKPDGFRVKLRRRPRRPVDSPAAGQSMPQPVQEAPLPQAAARLGVTLRVLYGSNLGTCEGFAQELAQEAERRGFDARAGSLDEAVDGLGDSPVAIIASSYNGLPPDNAAQFCAWLEQVGSLPPTPFAIFGCGNREWTNTYQAIPRALDEGLGNKGAQRLLPKGEGDASGDLDQAFREWKTRFWEALHAHLGVQPEAAAPAEPLYSVEVLEDLHPNPFAEVYGAAPMVVVENRELQNVEASGRSTRHIEFTLPEGVSYRPGDHLGVIPQNPPRLVARAAAAFGFTPELRIQLHKRYNAPAALPTERVLSVGALLTHYVELQDVATRHQLGRLVRHASNPADQSHLQGLADSAERYEAEVKKPALSLLDLLESVPSLQLPFGEFLEMVPPLRPRYYSISSSPQAAGRLVSITVGVVEGPARSGHGVYQGICSSYLGSSPRGRAVYAFVTDAQGTFSLPEDERTPLIMIGAGTGLAPYRGFLQDLRARARSGRQPAANLLFFGCRHRDHDYIYQQELEEMESQGLVRLFTAFSRGGDAKVYVQDRLAENGALIWQTLQQGGMLYVCGDASGMAAGVRAALLKLVAEHGGMTAEQADQYLHGLVADKRYKLDVWASS